jgi:beta-galactosidase
MTFPRLCPNLANVSHHCLRFRLARLLPGMVLVAFIPWLVAIGSTCRAQAAGADSIAVARETLSLDQGWRFHLGDIPLTDFRANADEAQGGAKGASAWGAAAPKYDDKAWRVLDLPHDWVIEQPFDQRAVKNQGYRPRGIAWYRRQFTLDPSDRGKHLEIQFDGVSTHCTVWFNGWPVARNWDGYSSFNVDITTMAQYGNAANTLAVRVDANDMEGWWYEGGGIYRHTWLVKRPPLHITTDGVYANPVKGNDGQWTIPLEVTLENSGTATAAANVEVSVIDPQGKKVAGGQGAATLDPWRQGIVKFPISVAAPQLWSVDKPTLYTVATIVTSDGKVDEVATQCGFRTLRFDVQKGFFLNDQPLKIQGVCCHQDQAGVGVAMPDALWEFRIRKLKEMGANAYRSAHNPPSKEFLDDCDRMGMLVLDENRHFNDAPEYLGQLQWLVRRDRNHPSIILWSIFNEENALQSSEQGKEVGRHMVAAIKSLDTTRPVTAAMNGGQLNGNRLNPTSVANVLDVVGINYQVDKYDQIRAAYTNQPILSTEDASQVSTRGEFTTDRSRNTVSSYDDKYQGWQSTNRSAWAAIDKQPSFAGGFLWSGFDYRGEPTPYGWPATSSYFGSLDLCGFPKTGFYIRQAFWIHDKPVLALMPHWNWQGQEGQPIKVRALTNADTVALSLNGKLLEEKKVVPYDMVDWQVPYAPGKLEAVARKDGKEVARFSVETTGAPVALRLTPDRTALAGDGADALPVTVEVLDDAGRPVPTANLPVEFDISGPGTILGVGNGDPTSHEPDKASKRSLFNGLAQVIVQSQRGAAGDLVLRAKAEGVKSAGTRIRVNATPLPPPVPVVK